MVPTKSGESIWFRGYRNMARILYRISKITFIGTTVKMSSSSGNGDPSKILYLGILFSRLNRFYLIRLRSKTTSSTLHLAPCITMNYY